MRTDPAFVRAADVEAARRLALDAVDHVDEIERDQRLPAELVARANDAGFFRMYAKAAVGGPELDPFTAYRVIEEIARVDGSFAWIAMLSSTTSYLTAWLPDDIVRAMRAVPGDLRLAGSSRPLGTANEEPGGFRFRGRWDFGSGIEHATWVIAMCKVLDGAHAGTMRAMFVRPSDIEIHRTWDVLGMRGSGSHDFTATEVFVPFEHTASFGGPLTDAPVLYSPRMMRVVAQAPTAAINVGVSLGLLDAFATLAKEAATTSSPTVLRERRAVQAAYAQATGMVEAARAFLLDSMAEAWCTAVEGRTDPGEAIVRTRLAFIHAAKESMRVSELLFTAAGTSGLFRATGIERRVRDLHVARLFKAYDESIAESAGRALLGLEPLGEGW
jgi:alkylation response protein AidB-like acyl-CoA dehydrogenase